MNLDTEQIKTRIEGRVRAIEDKREALQREMEQLDLEKGRFGEALSAVQTAEQKLAELHLLDDTEAVEASPEESETAQDGQEEFSKLEEAVQAVEQIARDSQGLQNSEYAAGGSVDSPPDTRESEEPVPHFKQWA